jgi:hypothetical protein
MRLNLSSSQSDELTVKTKTEKKRTTSTNEARRLVESATEQPGVAELFKVYESWQWFDQVFETQNRLLAPKQLVTTSSSCDPVLGPA